MLMKLLVPSLVNLILFLFNPQKQSTSLRKVQIRSLDVHLDMLNSIVPFLILPTSK